MNKIKYRLFDENGNDEAIATKIIGGNPTGLNDFNEVKYSWAVELWNNMIGNTWFVEKVSDFGPDAQDYLNSLDENEKFSYDAILSYLVFLDSENSHNPANFLKLFTSSEIRSILCRQTFEEMYHSKSYATLIEAVIPKERRQNVYDFWRTDKKLLTRIKKVSEVFQLYIDEPTETNGFKAFVAMYALEGLFFYNGFNFFYLLAKKGKMPGTKDCIKYINRDELTHVVFGWRTLSEIKQERPDLFDIEYVQTYFKEVTEIEIDWSNYVLGDKILGITKASTEGYTKWRTNRLMNFIGLPDLYPEAPKKNPYYHLELIASIEGGENSYVKSNFFERTVTEYDNNDGAVGADDSIGYDF